MAVRLLLAAIPMKWTTKSPTKSGFYWYRDDKRAVVLEVRDSVRKGRTLTCDWQQ